MAQQTAVEWLVEKLYKEGHFYYVQQTEIIDKAKQMEKEQIMKSFKSARIPYKYDADLTLNGFEDAEQYYNETFGKHWNY